MMVNISYIGHCQMSFKDNVEYTCQGWTFHKHCFIHYIFVVIHNVDMYCVTIRKQFFRFINVIVYILKYIFLFVRGEKENIIGYQRQEIADVAHFNYKIFNIFFSSINGISCFNCSKSKNRFFIVAVTAFIHAKLLWKFMLSIF